MTGAVLAVTVMLAAMWAGPPAAASAGTQPRAAFSSPAPAPAPVKFYIVPPPGDGPAESLFAIAAKTLGDGSQFVEIFNLNKGRLQPNGGRLTTPQLIDPGWILQLPADAAGPGVRFGPLPVVTAPMSHHPSQSAGTGSAIVISGALLAFLTAGLALGLIRSRAGRTRRRRPAPVRAPGAARRASRGGLQHDHDRYMTGAAPLAGAASADLGGVATDVTENLVGSAPPTTKPVTRPAAQPIARPAPEPVAEPAARSAARPTTKPGTRQKSRAVGKQGTGRAPKPTARSAAEGRPRQLVAIRLAAVATASLVLFALIAGTTEVALHGFRFFVFRSAGTGETGPNGLQEDQGPGQPDAPRPAPGHVKVRLSPPSAATAPDGK